MNFVLRPAALCAALALAAALAPLPTRADDIQDINKLIRAGQHAQAMDRVNQVLAKKPRDAQARFLKGVIFAEQNKPQEAIDVFAKLSQDYPELPEPYNNLAVLYAAQGQYEKARQQLEMSIRTHP
ncbi:MAG TPA: Wzy polymerase domain-containing protein, partial [Casimicrobiaceae bacterium]|nr:Wzy polymerase domain-containing protein [Casimicrobiaceae bacterium]